MLKKLAAISLTAGALVLIAPGVATAAPSGFAPAETGSYTETPGVTVEKPVIDPCEVSTIRFSPGYFVPGERLSVSVSGKDGGDAAVSGNTAGSDGGMIVTFSPPKGGEGTYSVAFDGTRSYTATVTVTNGGVSGDCDDDPGIAASNTELALTGGAVSPWAIGGGALALTAGGVLIAAAARRKRA